MSKEVVNMKKVKNKETLKVKMRAKRIPRQCNLTSDKARDIRNP